MVKKETSNKYFHEKIEGDWKSEKTYAFISENIFTPKIQHYLICVVVLHLKISWIQKVFWNLMIFSGVLWLRISKIDAYSYYLNHFYKDKLKKFTRKNK
jgi:hypothetical protein